MENSESKGQSEKLSEIHAGWEIPTGQSALAGRVRCASAERGDEMNEVNDELRAVFRAVEDALAGYRDITEMRDVSVALANAAVMARMIAGLECGASLADQLQSLRDFREEVGALVGATAISLVDEYVQEAEIGDGSTAGSR